MGRSRSPRASKSTTPPRPPHVAISRGDLALRPEGHAPDIALLDLQRRGSEPLAPGVEEHHAAADAPLEPPYPAAIWPSGPKATLVTLPSLTSSGAGRSRSPRASKSTTPPPAADAISRGDLALRPEGHARDIALLDLQRRGSEPLATGVEEHHAAAAAAAAISRGDLALRPEGHARDMALLDLQRRGSEPLAPGVEEHHAAAAAAAISRGDLALRPEGHARDRALLDLQRRGSEPLAPGVEEHHAADADAADAISRGDLALRPEGHAPDIALLDLQRRGSEPLAPGVEEHHAAAPSTPNCHIPRRSCPPARRPRS